MEKTRSGISSGKQDTAVLISGVQLAVLICVCRLPSILFGFSGDGEEQIWSVLIGEGIRLLLCLPVCIAFAAGWTLPEGFLGGLFRWSAAFCLVLEVGRLATDFGGFAVDTLYPGSSAFFFGGALLLLALYGTHMGLEAAARAALPILILFSIGILLTAIGVRDEIRLIQLRPVEDSAMIWKNGFRMGLLPDELLIFLVAGRQTSGRAGKLPALTGGFGLSAVMLALASFLSGTVLGGLQRSAGYPFFKVETLMSLSIFQRMDAWFLALWTGVLFIRCLFLLWAAKQLVAPYTKVHQKFLLPVLGAAALTAMFLLLRNDILAQNLKAVEESGWQTAILYGLLMILWVPMIPLKRRKS